MKTNRYNLFDLALEIRTYRYIVTGLKDITDSGAFSSLPDNLKKRATDKLTEYTLKEQNAALSWPGDAAVLSEFIDHFGDCYKYPETDDIVLVTKLSRLVRQYITQSLDQAQNMFMKADIKEPSVKKGI